ncbi:MAG TPA: dihydrodipicolinate synthase family protein [Candidatus Rubrimentiphilum sp.]|nr:dihydrodipicolinate synthase family protein [Candidatus Rubrimentiphilum sp.]
MFNGAIAFPVTPFQSDGSVDIAGVRSNLEMIASSGVASIVAPSGTGELFSLTEAECSAITKASVEAANKRKPVIASVGFGPRAASELARSAEANGADGILVLPPYYQNPDADGLFNYYMQIARSTPLPFAVYARDAAYFTPDLVERLAKDAPTFAAFKDGRGDIRTFMRIREYVIDRLGPGRLAWLGGVGDDLLAPYAAAGAEGFTSSMACFWPEIAAELWSTVKNDRARFQEIHRTAIRPFYELRARKRGYEVSVMKAATEILGYAAGPPRPPITAVSRSEYEEIRDLLKKLNVPTMKSRGALA